MSQFSSTFCDFLITPVFIHLQLARHRTRCWVSNILKQYACPHYVWCTVVRSGKAGTRWWAGERCPGGGNSWIKIWKLGRNYPREERMRRAFKKATRGSKCGEKECWLRGQYVLQGSFNSTLFSRRQWGSFEAGENEMIRCIFLESVEIRENETGAVRRPIGKENNMCT